ncbi:MAG: hypothetical protein WCJ75_06575 [Desulfomonile sp.]
MMGKSHFWVVCDAVAYIKKQGNEAQKTALQTFEIAYGENKPVDSIPPHETAVERLAGFESLHTDKFGDLALTFRSLPGGGKTNITGLGFHMFTAFNHFINPYPDTDASWPSASGYAYTASSMKGFDSLVVKGISEHLSGLVDVENSLVLDRIKFFWKDGIDAWNTNFEQDLSGTKFAPWNVLARFYHTNLLCNHYEPLEVRGPNEHIVGLQLLGPLVHAASDACSVQHVRSSLGFGHSVWENYLKSKVYNRQINVNAKLVSQFLSEEPFEPSPIVSEGPLEGRFDVGVFIYMLAARTADRLQESTSQTWSQLWKEGDKFWRNYLLGSTMRDDAHYLYNMAVAGTVHVIVKSYEDMVNQGILLPERGLLHREKMPDLPRIQHDIPQLPTKKTIDGLPSEEVMPVPFSNARDLLGFDPTGRSNIQHLVSNVSELLSKITHEKLDTGRIKRVFKDIEKELIEQYVRMADRVGEGFCPLRAVEKLPLDSDLSAHFGTGTFRMPSSEECDDPRSLAQYIDLSDAHAYKANKLQLTQLVAGLKFYRMKFEQQEGVVSRIDKITSGLEQLRDVGQHDAAAEAFDLVTPRVAMKSRVGGPREASPVDSKTRNIFSAFQEWIAPLFQVPVAALATVAAAALLVVVMFPRGVPEPVMGLSSEKWDKPQLMLMAPKSLPLKAEPAHETPKLRMAMIINFKNFKEPINQETVDSSYRSIKPTAAMEREYDILSPYKFKEAVDQGEISTHNLQETMDGLVKLGVSRALVLTVTARGNLFEVETDLKNLETGQTLNVITKNDISRDDLPSVMRKSIQEQFAPE